MVPGRTVAHQREKLTDFSDKIMRKDKQIERSSAAVRRAERQISPH
jgi:hypothetical protein